MTNLNDKAESLLRNFDIEIQTKYFYSCLYSRYVLTGNSIISINVIDLSNGIGISKNRIYRARAKLVKMGYIILHKMYCPSTGKRTEDIYELI